MREEQIAALDISVQDLQAVQVVKTDRSLKGGRGLVAYGLDVSACGMLVEQRFGAGVLVQCHVKLAVGSKQIEQSE